MLRNLTLLILIKIALFPFSTLANDSLCAEVKIEIMQEMTLERQGFEAMMRITNSLDSFTLEDVTVSVNFSDENGNRVIATSNTAASDAAFFIRIDDTRHFSSIQIGADGLVENGRIPPKSDGELRWLIIPTGNAAGQRKDGKLYFVGAQLSYSYGGKQESVTVAPDTIIVKPQPLLTLDYFLTEHIVGDDAFTPEIEPPEPYTLGVRISNSGYGYANAVKIESAQPRIIENEQGLAIDFRILGSYLQDEPADPTLLINFGTIEPQGVTTGRWIMQTSLSGKFSAFSASFTHADELGGELTSLLEATNAHFLVRDVLVDLPGRDTLRDFLAYSTQRNLFVYESENTGLQSAFCQHCAEVNAVTASYTHQGMTGQISHNPVAGFSYAKVRDPFNGSRLIANTSRSDGKTLHPQNTWLSKERAADDRSFDYYLNIFDTNSTGEYRINWGIAVADVPQAPIIQFIANRTTYEGGSVGFLVQASDPNNTIPYLSVQQLPTGAAFTHQASNIGVFQWAPAIGQAGLYNITFVASDGVLASEQTVTIRVNPHYDIDGDGMDDDWEMEHFGNLDRDGTGDADGDGRTDLQEFLEGTNPNVAEIIPGTPQVFYPVFDSDTLTGAEEPFYPRLAVRNSHHSTGIDNVSVRFEIYRDEGLTELLATATIPEAHENTEWLVSSDHLVEDSFFTDNTLYYWRARAHDNANPMVTSAWVKSRFFINSVNDAPGKPGISSPADNSLVSDLSPELVVTNATDPDRDRLYYSFALFEEANPDTPIAEVSNLLPGNNGHTKWRVPRLLKEDHHYLWQAKAADQHGLSTESDWSSFLISTINHAPTQPEIFSPEFMARIIMLDENNSLLLRVKNAIDPERQPLLYYFEVDQVNTFDSNFKIISPAINEENKKTSWKVSHLLENTHYFWRVRAHDGELFGSWAISEFMVAGVNEAPTTPVIQNPVNGSVVATLRPLLEINPSTDPEDDDIRYEFQLFADSDFIHLVADYETAELFWAVPEDLVNTTTYYWRVRAKDTDDLASEWSESVSFTVTIPAINQPPHMEFVLPNSDITVENNRVLLQWIDSDPDSSATIALYYHYEGGSAQLIVDGLSEDADGEGDQYLWDTTGLPAGIYTISAIIADEESRVEVNLCCEITILESTTAPEYIDGLLGYYYSHVGHITNLNAAKQYVNNASASALFSATRFDYTGTGGLGLDQRIVSFLNQDAASLQGNIFSTNSAILKFEGKILLPSGNYRFRISADEGYQIHINNQIVGEHASNGGVTNRIHSGFRIIEEGWQDINIIYWDVGQDHRLILELSTDGGNTFNPLSDWSFKHMPVERTPENVSIETNLLSSGLTGLHYTYQAPNPHHVTLGEILTRIQESEPSGHFIASHLDYGPGTGGLGSNNNLISFLGVDANSLNFSPPVSNSVILNMKGYLELPAGTYRLRVRADDGYRIKINESIIAEQPVSQAATTRVHNAFMINDEGFYELDIIYWDNGYGHIFTVEFSNDNGEVYEVLASPRLLRNTYSTQ